MSRLPRRPFAPRRIALIFALVLAVAGSLLFLHAQDPPNPADDDPPADILPPPAPREDPGYDGDPTPKEDLSVLGDPLLPGDQDPQFLQEELPGAPEDEAAAPPPPPAMCQTWTAPVTPVGVSNTYMQHYFSYQNKPVLLVGVSADNGCHLELQFSDKCEIGAYGPGAIPGRATPAYQAILDDAAAKGLNKIRLWVSFGFQPNPEFVNDPIGEKINQPFKAVDGGLTGSGKAYHYRLDMANPDYFPRLREVVRYAATKKIFVEVTFFAPGEGEKTIKSPWLKSTALATGGAGTTAIGFSDLHYFSIPAAPGSADEAMRQYQKNIIDWTVDELWCYDRVYWEIANEPEAPDLKPADVAKWQSQMIGFVKAAEARHPLLTGGHLIAVQPFTKKGADLWAAAASAANVVNGHYTQAATPTVKNFPDRLTDVSLDLGAIRLAREYWTNKKIFAMNEDNITPLSGSKGTRGLRTDANPRTRPFGIPDPVRAEVWEFLLDGGGSFDHFGYLYNSGDGVKVRTQLGLIAKFLTAVVPVWTMTPNKAPAWVAIGDYPNPTSWEATDSRRYWAAMESANWQTSAVGRKFLAYFHHSTSRCKGNEDDVGPRVDAAGNVAYKCAGQNLSLDAYDARLRANLRYKETNLRLTLGNQPGTFKVFWLDAKTPNESAPLAFEEIHWNPAGGGSCDGRMPCTVTSPSYPYDIVLEVRQ